MKLDQLTFTRYIAALSVVFFHYGDKVFPASVPLLHPVITAGSIAVSYFYVLSGFIMAVAYYKTSTEPQNFNSKRYWLARFARIYPVYLIALLLMVAAKLHGAGSDPMTVLLSVGMLQAWIPSYPLSLNAPGWSLSVEVFFYLVFPALIFLCKRQQLKFIAIMSIIFWVATQVLHTVLLNNANYVLFNTLHDLIYYNPIMHLNTFVMGFVVGVALREGKLQCWRDSKLNLFGLAFSGALIFGLLVARQPFIDYTGIRLDYTNGLIAPLFITVIALLSLNTTRLSLWLQHKWLILLGEASFSLYILQKPLHGIYEKLLAQHLDTESNLYFYVFALSLTGISILSFYWVETPARRFINSFGSSSDKSG